MKVRMAVDDPSVRSDGDDRAACALPERVADQNRGALAVAGSEDQEVGAFGTCPHGGVEVAGNELRYHVYVGVERAGGFDRLGEHEPTAPSTSVVTSGG